MTPVVVRADPIVGRFGRCHLKGTIVRTRGLVRRFAAALLALSAGGAAASASAQVTDGAGASGGTWGNARELPGLASLNVTGLAFVVSVSCGAPANCGAGGLYSDATGQQQPFVASERNGRWQTLEVPVIGLANSGNGETFSVSCRAASNCTAGGFYTDDSGAGQAFVVTERNGAWGRGQEVPGLRALNAGGDATINSVSCLAEGNCVADGHYTDRFKHRQGFVVVQRNGRWGTAEEVPGLARLNRGGNAETFAVSCAASGCTAAGWYADAAGRRQGFVTSERGSRWSRAATVPGLARLNRGGFADVISVSCPTAVSCGATGLYTDARGHIQSYVVTQRSGRWGDALEVPRLGRLNTGGDAEPSTLSCWTAGDCSVAGVYSDATNNQQPFAATELGNRWGWATEMPGTARLDRGESAGINSVSCVRGICAAGGFYERGATTEAFVVTVRDGRWGTARPVPGLARLNTGQDASLYALSCAAVSRCTAVGVFDVHHASDVQGFVVSER